MQLNRLHPDFGVEIAGLSPADELTKLQTDELRNVFETESLLLLRGPVLTDEQQLAFSEIFGAAQRSASGNLTGGRRLSRQSNIDPNSGELMPRDHPRMQYQLGTREWHSDSSYRQSGSLCSILAAREVPPTGGNTEFVSTRAAYSRLAQEKRAKLDGLSVIHRLAQLRSTSSAASSDAKIRDEFAPARHALVQQNPINGAKSLLIGAHAASIEGWDEAAGTALLEEILEHATAPECIYSHRWQAGDLLIWDNRCVLHRSTPYDSQRHRRWLERATIPLRVEM